MSTTLDMILEEFKLLNTTLISIENKLGGEEKLEENLGDYGKKVDCKFRIGPADEPYSHHQGLYEAFFTGWNKKVGNYVVIMEKDTLTNEQKDVILNALYGKEPP